MFSIKKKILYVWLLSITCFGNFQLACFGALESLGNKNLFIHLARMDKAVFPNLQGSLVVYFLCHPLYVQIPSGIQFLKSDQVTQPISSNMPSQLTYSGQDIWLETSWRLLQSELS